jgi:hypothetical protein
MFNRLPDTCDDQQLLELGRNSQRSHVDLVEVINSCQLKADKVTIRMQGYDHSRGRRWQEVDQTSLENNPGGVGDCILL